MSALEKYYRKADFIIENYRGINCMTMETDPADLESQEAIYNSMRPIVGNAISDASIEIYNAAGFEISVEAARPFVDFVRALLEIHG